jgi:hypothetical protein
MKVKIYLVFAICLVLMVGTAFAIEPIYADINPEQWFYTDVMELSEQLRLSGGEFKSSEFVTQQEASKLISTALGTGMQGTDSDKFATRGEVCFMISNAFHERGGSNVSAPVFKYFSDTEEDWVGELFELGILSGYGNAIPLAFRSNQLISRAELFTLVNRILKVSGETSMTPYLSQTKMLAPIYECPKAPETVDDFILVLRYMSTNNLSTIQIERSPTTDIQTIKTNYSTAYSGMFMMYPEHFLHFGKTSIGLSSTTLTILIEPRGTESGYSVEQQAQKQSIGMVAINGAITRLFERGILKTGADFSNAQVLNLLMYRSYSYRVGETSEPLLLDNIIKSKETYCTGFAEVLNLCYRLCNIESYGLTLQLLPTTHLVNMQKINGVWYCTDISSASGMGKLDKEYSVYPYQEYLLFHQKNPRAAAPFITNPAKRFFEEQLSENLFYFI